MLELDRGMGDLKSAEHIVDALQDGVAFRRRHIFDQHVTAQRVRAGTEAPDVQIVNVDDAIDLAHCSGDLVEFHATRQAFEQNV